MRTPTISVIVPVYNVEKYLPRCIDSILAQTFTDFELILVDDGSPDRCGVICDEYAEKDKRVRVIHKENGGVSSARNAGLDDCKGEYVTFVDSDDYIAADRVADLYETICRFDADEVSAGFTIFDEQEYKEHRPRDNERVWGTNNEAERIDFLLNRILQDGNGWAVWNRLFKTEIIKEHHIRFCETCGNFGEDLGFTLEYALYCTRFAVCDHAGYFYYQRDNSMMANSIEKIKLDEMNEVSYHFGQRFFSELQSADLKKLYPVLHYKIMSLEYKKLFMMDHISDWNTIIQSINHKKWFIQNTVAAPRAYRLFVRYYGKGDAREAMIASANSLFGTWNLYKRLYRKS